MSFAPVYGPGSRALILGSWPSPKSWDMGFYYGHPHNRFWPLLARLTGEALPAREDVAAKRKMILDHGLALWDVLASCTIEGASDASIRDAVPEDIGFLLARAPVEAVFCNGAAAYRLYVRYMQPVSGIGAVRLPSTSPANAAWSLDRLQEAWGAALGPYLGKKIIRTEKPSALPFYAAAAAGLALCAALPVYKMWALAVALAGAAAAFAAARRVCPPQVIEREVPFHTGDGDVDEMLTGIQKQLDTLRALNDALPDPQLSAAMDRMEKAGRSILEVVEQAPAKAKQIRRFANYYLPDAVHVLEQYAAMARQGVRGENAAAVRSEVEKNVGMIAAAFEHQLDALYAAESMDLSADLAVLETLMKNQGL